MKIGNLIEVLNWALNYNKSLTLKTTNSVKKLKIANQIERKIVFGNSTTVQWTTRLGENLVKDVFQKILNQDIWRPKQMNGFKPDFETNKFIIEVKTRNWTTPGTAGEKVLGVPYKYSKVPKLYGKPLLIVLVGYQEYECSNGKLNVFDPDCEIQKELLTVYKKHNIHYVRFSDLILNPSKIANY